MSAEHSLSNVRKTPMQMVEELAKICRARDESGAAVEIEGALSTAFGCTMAGAVPEDDVLRIAEACLRAGIDSGEFREVDPRLTALAWLGMHNYTYLWLKPGGRVSARDAAKPFADIFIKGIAAS